jgi:acetolactate synthase-1/2/3 large subunit
VREWKERYPLSAPKREEGRTGISAYDFSRTLSDQIPEGALIVPGSSGFACEIFFLMLQIKREQRCFHNRGTGSMGLSIPSTVGACIASGNKLTVSVDGDGGFFFNVQELATVARLRLPIKLFVVNNNGYASIRSSQTGYFDGNLVGCDPSSGLELPSIQAVARAFGVGVAEIGPGDDIRDKVRESLSRPGPVVCEVRVMADEPREPRLSSSRLPDGSMVSRPIEDLYPFLDRDEFECNMLPGKST